MSTHSIGKDNVLIGVCVPKPVRDIIGREATADDRSLANFVYSAALNYWRATRPELAAQIDAARIRRGAVCLALCLGIVVQLLAGNSEARRVVRRNGRRQEMELAELSASLVDGEVVEA